MDSRLPRESQHESRTAKQVELANLLSSARTQAGDADRKFRSDMQAEKVQLRSNMEAQKAESEKRANAVQQKHRAAVGKLEVEAKFHSDNHATALGKLEKQLINAQEAEATHGKVRAAHEEDKEEWEAEKRKLSAQWASEKSRLLEAEKAEKKRALKSSKDESDAKFKEVAGRQKAQWEAKHKGHLQLLQVRHCLCRAFPPPSWLRHRRHHVLPLPSRLIHRVSLAARRRSTTRSSSRRSGGLMRLSWRQMRLSLLRPALPPGKDWLPSRRRRNLRCTTGSRSTG